MTYIWYICLCLMSRTRNQIHRFLPMKSLCYFMRAMRPPRIVSTDAVTSITIFIKGSTASTAIEKREFEIVALPVCSTYCQEQG
jgi:hypothetical protein